MKNYKFERAARLRKVTAFFLTVLTVFGLVSLLFFQSEGDALSEFIESIADIFLESKE